MFVTSFYSFKGGVGRTMALINSAIVLSEMGHKVLLVDFDLEAPSLPTYESLECSHDTPGIVDYIASYRASGVAPDAQEYIAECKVGTRPLWVMPAGKATDGYGSQLQAIDWADLYQNFSGFLLLEDLKQQWKTLGFDYVLIDSRTGHTDVGGICTRQLPDLVVILFVPNEQNISGLEQIVDGIRLESHKEIPKTIGILFCPSNVPDLDDEKDILKSNLDSASDRLKFIAPAAMIHHYPSLEILSQRPFVLHRPNTKLSREYRELAKAIIASNIADREGALLNLRNILRNLRNPDIPLTPENVETFYGVTTSVRQHHPDDAEIAYELSRVLSNLGDIEGELEALSAAVKAGAGREEALRRRAAIYLQLGRREDGIRDLERILNDGPSDPVILMPTIEMLRSIDTRWMEKVLSSAPVKELKAGPKTMLIELFQSSKRGHDEAIRMAREVLDDESASPSTQRAAQTELTLSLIGSGRFTEALDEMGVTRTDIVRGGVDIVETFNFAFAEWGATGEPAPEILDLVVRQAKQFPFDDPNFEQCLALCHYVLGHLGEGDRHVGRARQAMGLNARSFSCWRYVYVTRDVFFSDLDAMQEQARGKRLTPPVLKGKRTQ